MTQNKTLKMKVKDLRAMMWGGHGPEGFEWVGRQFVGQGRWETHYICVFKNPEGVLYGFDFAEGSTEQQSNNTFDDAGDTIDCYPVEIEMVPKYKLRKPPPSSAKAAAPNEST